MKSLAFKSLLSILLLSLSTNYCFAKHVKAPPDPRFLSIESITLLPVLDARVDKKSNVDLQRLRKQVESILRKKKYVVAEGENASGAGEIVEEDLQEAT